MIRTAGLLALASILALSAAGRAIADQDSKAAAVTSALSGGWRGTLEYRDYKSDKRVTLPTTLVAKGADDGRSVSFPFRYDEGKGRFVEGGDTLRIDPEKATLTWESADGKSKTEYKLAGLDTFDSRSGGELVLTGPGVENKVDVEVRQTITLVGEELTILRESRTPGAEFAFRNRYTLRRDGSVATPPRTD